MQPSSARPVTARVGRIPPGFFALPFGVLILLTGLWGGLARLGYTVPSAGTSTAQHGFLMSLGFLGTLIATERAVALGRWWAWTVPALSVFGSGWLVFGGLPWIGYASLLVAGVLLVEVYGQLHRIQPSTHNTLMGLAAAGWAVAALLAVMGRPTSDTVPWLAIFLVVTITAERLELSRMLKRSKPVRLWLIVAILCMVAGATTSIWVADIGIRIAGVSMVAMAVWLGIYDLARRTVRSHGVTRFMAAGLLTGYAWLAAGGVLWAVAGHQHYGALYDAQLHIIFLGFVMSMVFAHAPVIAPAVIRKPLPYFPAFYGPLVLLHAALLLRVIAGDAFGARTLWRIGGVLNELAILAFVGVTIGAFVRAAVTERARRAAVAQRARGAAPAGDARTSESGHPAPAHPPVAARNRPTPARVVSGVIGGAVGVAIVVAAIVYAMLGPTRSGGDVTAEPADGTVVSAAQAAAGVPVSLVEMRIEPSVITVAPGTHLVLKVTNDGTMPHDLKLATGPITPMLDPGESAVLDAGTISAPVDGWCTVPGHRAMGMTMSIDVAATDTTGHAGPDGMSSHTGPDGMTGQTDPDATSADLAGTPPAGWRAVDATLPPADDAVVHDVTWHITDVETAVAPDATQQLWTFDGRVPGPVLRGKVGDRFNITVVNDTEMMHNIDFHAESGPPAAVMTPIDPGATHTYSFVATHAGAWLYHCSIAPMLLHLGNGMYGALIIDPPDLPVADSEFVLVGSELFFGPQEGIADYDKMLADRPDAVVFNGYPFAYRQQPLHATVGDLVRVWVVNAGPTRPIGFHVIGAPFTTEYLNGAYVLKDGQSLGAESGAAQTLPVDPGNGGFVEFRFTEAGSYPFVSHRMADAAIGAAGVFVAEDPAS